jgi:hypothetical protein
VDAVAALGDHRVLLLKPEEGLEGLHLVVDDGGEGGAGVGRVGLAVGAEDLAHDEQVRGAADGVGHHARGAHDAVRVVALGLPRGGAVVGPVAKVLGVEGLDGLLEALGLGAHLVELEAL